MTQEDKELLFKDLSARLPYGIICKCYHTEFDEWDGKPFIAIYNDTLKNIDVNGFFLLGGFSYEIDEIKPYLRPMSSMTEDERKEYELLANRCITNSVGFIHFEAQELINWLLKNHFDFCGLIPKGLAIEVTEENNPYK